MILRWALRELRNQPRTAVFFVLNLSLGLSGFIALNSFRSSLEDSLRQNAKNFLSADLSVSARRLLTANEKSILDQVLTAAPEHKVTRLWEMFSMVSTPGQGRSRLVQVRGLEKGFPFYGELKLARGGAVTRDFFPLRSGEAFAYPELLKLLNVQVGDIVHLGEKEFRIVDTVESDTTQTFRLASLAPRIFVHRSDLEQTGLVQKGTTLSESYLIQAPDASVPGLKERFKELLQDPAVQIEDSTQASQDSARALQYLSDYLGLVSLVALFLSALGTLYLFRSYMLSKLRSIAIWNALGLQKTTAQRIYLVQLLVLGATASVLSLVFSWLVLPLISQILAEFTPIQLNLFMTPAILGLALLLGTLGAVLICYPMILPLVRLPTAQLFQEHSQLQIQWNSRTWLAFVPALLVFVLLSFWQARSFRIGGVFLGVLAVALAFFLVLGWALVQWGEKRPQSRLPWEFRQGLLYLSRKKLVTLMAFVCLSLGSFLMNFVPQLRAGLREELEAPQSRTLPSLFLFDIQLEQLEPLKEFLAQKSLELRNVSPLIRARLVSVNGKSFERQENSEFQTREQDTEARFRNRGFNLSYRDHMSDSESLVAGQPFVAGSQVPQISVEKRFAERLGFHLGDRLQFDIQGVNVDGIIQNFRSVKWNSFQPNFFVVFQPGVLEESPQILLASLVGLTPSQKEEVQTAIVEKFPNISMVDVRRVVERIFEVSTKMGWALQIMAILSLIAGFVVLTSMALDQVQRRIWDLNMIKIFGAPARSLRRMLIFEFVLLGFLASIVGIGLSLIGSAVMTQVVFEAQPAWDLIWPTLSLFGNLIITAILGSVLAGWVMRSSPRDLLQNRD